MGLALALGLLLLGGIALASRKRSAVAPDEKLPFGSFKGAVNVPAGDSMLLSARNIPAEAPPDPVKLDRLEAMLADYRVLQRKLSRARSDYRSADDACDTAQAVGAPAEVVTILRSIAGNFRKEINRLRERIETAQSGILALSRELGIDVGPL